MLLSKVSGRADRYYKLVKSLKFCSHCRFCEGTDLSNSDPVHHASLELTMKCNHRCIFCYSEVARKAGTAPKPGYYSSPDRKLKPRSITVSQYGEPLMLGLPALAGEMLKLRKRFPKARIDLQTNGTLLNREAVGQLSRFVNLVMVSVNASSSGTHEKISGAKTFKQLLRGLKAASGFNAVKIVRVVHCPGINDSDREIKGIAKLAERNGFDEIMIHQCAVYPETKARLEKAGFDFEENESIPKLLEAVIEAREACGLKVTLQGCVLSKLKLMPKEVLPALAKVNISKKPGMKRVGWLAAGEAGEVGE